MNYVSTRNNKLNISGCEAIVRELSSNDNLFVPTVFPKLSKDDIARLENQDFPERAAFVMSLFLEEFSFDELLDLTSKAYATFDGDPCPLVNVDGAINFLELWHGPSASSSDFGMAVLPYLLAACKKKLVNNSKNLVLVVSKPDIVKAACESFKNVSDIKVLAFYPYNDLSAIQKLQMQTQVGNNVDVSALSGDFDDFRNDINSLSKDQNFLDTLAQKGYELTFANTESWGALLPRIACFVSCYIDLLTSKQIAESEKFNVFASSDDFGNVIACVYAKKMGIPIGNIVCATKGKDTIIEFFNKGAFDVKCKSKKDFLSTSNVERILFEVFENDNQTLSGLLKNLETSGKIQIDVDLLLQKLPFILAGFATESEIKETIAVANEEFDYVVDLNTATALSVFDDYNFETDDDTLPVIISTASPFTDPRPVLEAISGIREKDEFNALKKLQEATGILAPEHIAKLKESEIRFEKEIDKHQIKKTIFDYLGE